MTVPAQQSLLTSEPTLGFTLKISARMQNATEPRKQPQLRFACGPEGSPLGTYIWPQQRHRTMPPFPIKSGQISRGAYCTHGQCKPCSTWLLRLWGSPDLPFVHIRRDHQAQPLEAEANLSGRRPFALSGKIFIIRIIYFVVNVGQSPLSQLELTGQALSLQGAGQWRALIYPVARCVGGWQGHGVAREPPRAQQP